MPLGQFADRVLAWIGTPGRTPDEVRQWAESNREGLRTFWAEAPSDALELKRVIEARSAGPAQVNHQEASNEAALRHAASDTAGGAAEKASSTTTPPMKGGTPELETIEPGPSAPETPIAASALLTEERPSQPISAHDASHTATPCEEL